MTKPNIVQTMKTILSSLERQLRLPLVLTVFMLLGFLSMSGQVDDAVEKKASHNIKVKGKFGVAPFVTYNTSLGGGFGIIPMYSFKPNPADTVSVSSVLGAGAIYTTNKSSIIGLFGALYFDQNRWRVFYGLGRGTFTFQTYLDIPIIDEGVFIGYQSTADAFYVKARRTIYSNLLVGLGYQYTNAVTTFEDAIDVPLKTNMLKAELLWDTRNYLLYPKEGTMFIVRLNYMPEWMRNKKTSSVIISNFNHYFPMVSDRDVLAIRAHVRAGLENISFQQQAALGGTDLRGYSQGKYRGDGVIDGQAEYRWNFKNNWRLGAVAFAGVGTVYGSVNEDFNWKLYPSIGAGIRYTVLPDDHFNVGLDFGLGKDDWGLYFRIGEAF